MAAGRLCSRGSAGRAGRGRTRAGAQRHPSSTCSFVEGWSEIRETGVKRGHAFGRHANARVTGQLYAGLSDKAKSELATKLTEAGIGS